MDAPARRGSASRRHPRLSIAAVRSHQRDDSPTFDEAIHLFSGAEALEDGSGWLNPEHPPLLKLAGAFALRPLHLPRPARSCRAGPTPFNGYLRWLYGNAAPADVIVAAGRRPFPWLLALLVVALHLGVRRFAGPAAGLLAAGLVAFDPGFVAHAAYVHTDVGAALAFLVVIAPRTASRQRDVPSPLAPPRRRGRGRPRHEVLDRPPRPRRPGLAVPRPPAASEWLEACRRPAWRVTRDRLAGAVVALAVAATVVYGVYAFTLRRMSPEAVEASVRSLPREPPGPAGRGRDLRPHRPPLAAHRSLSRRTEGCRPPERAGARCELVPGRDLGARLPALLSRRLPPEVDAGVPRVPRLRVPGRRPEAGTRRRGLPRRPHGPRRPRPPRRGGGLLPLLDPL